MSKNITRKKVGFLGLATLAVVSPLSLMVGGTPAVAAATDTCDTALTTITVTDAVTGEPLQGARMWLQAASGTNITAGDQRSLESDFKEAFLAELPTLEDTDFGQAVLAAYQETLGTDNKPAYPADITGVVGPSQRRLALQEWQFDTDGRIHALQEDVLRRLDAVNEVKTLMEQRGHDTLDPQFYAHVVTEYGKLQALSDNITTAKTANVMSGWDIFVTAYNQFTDVDNWSYGLSETPAAQLQDVTLPNFDHANNAAGEAVEAYLSTAGYTNADGEAAFTNFGVKHAWKDRGTRGDDTCSQLASDATMVKAPNGYQMDNATYTVASDATGVATLTIALNPEDVTDPEVPIRTDTGL